MVSLLFCYSLCMSHIFDLLNSNIVGLKEHCKMWGKRMNRMVNVIRY